MISTLCKQMNIFKFKNWGSVFLCLYSFWLCLPSVQSILGAKFGILTICAFYIVVFLNKKFILKFKCSFFIINLIAFLLTAHLTIVYSVGLKNFLILFPQIFMCFFPLIAVYYIVNEEFNQKCFKFIFICLAVTLVSTSFWLSSSPNAVRTLGYGGADENYLKYLMRLGIGGFGFIYALPLLLPLLVEAFLSSSNKFYKFASLCFIGAIIIVVFLSKYFLAMFLLGISVIGSLFFSLLKKHFHYNGVKMFLFFMCLLLICFALFYAFSNPLLTFLSDNLSRHGYADYSEKILAIKYILFDHIYQGEDIQRFNNYFIGINTIMKSPLVGIRNDGGYAISGHSTFIDIFADSGIPFGLLFISLFFSLIYMLNKPYFSSKHSFILIWNWFIIFLLGLCNVMIYSREAFLIASLYPLIFCKNTTEQL